MTRQQEPGERIITIHTDLMPGSAYRLSTLDVMALWGYSRTVARGIIKEGRVFSGGYGPVGDTFVVDFGDGDEDFCALIVQKMWGIEYWNKSGKALTLRARRLTLIEKIRLWLVRHVCDKEWLPPRAGGGNEPLRTPLRAILGAYPSCGGSY